MSTSIIQQIADAMLARIQSVAGIGDTGLVPRAPTMITDWPACFLSHVEGQAEPGTMGGAGRKVSTSDFIWYFYINDLDAFTQLADLRKGLNDAIESEPYDMGIEGVFRPFCKAFKLFNPATSTDLGVGELTVSVTHTEPYGSA